MFELVEVPKAEILERRRELLGRMKTLSEEFHAQALAINCPAGFSAMGGLMSNLIHVYERTLDEGIDFTDPEQPLVALAGATKKIEANIAKILHPYANVSLKILQETP